MARSSTTLVANPYGLNAGPGLNPYLRTSATLTSSGRPVSGKAITFTASGQMICTATTDASGLAQCSGLLDGLQAVITSGGYQATFAGTETLLPSTATGGLVTLDQTPLL